jgi:Polyketide cyclase / dehydrase and lipid transport
MREPNRQSVTPDQEPGMATIIKTAFIDASADAVWDALADFGALHTRVAPGFVTDVVLEPGARIVTFGSGMVARELFLGADHAARRIAYSLQADTLQHHSASCQVADLGGGRSHFTWIADVLPDDAAPMIAGMMEEGLKIAAATMGRVPA